MKVNFKKVFKRAVMSALALSMISKSVFAFSISPASVEVEIGTKQTFEIMLEEGEQLVPGSVQWSVDGVRVTGRDHRLTVTAAKVGTAVIGATGELSGTISGSSISGNLVSARAKMVIKEGILEEENLPSANDRPNAMDSGLYNLEGGVFEGHKPKEVYLAAIEIDGNQYGGVIKELVNYSGNLRGLDVTPRSLRDDSVVKMTGGKVQFAMGMTRVNSQTGEEIPFDVGKLYGFHINADGAVVQVGESDIKGGNTTEIIAITTDSFSPFVLAYVPQGGSDNSSDEDITYTFTNATPDNSIQSVLKVGSITLASGRNLKALGADATTIANTTLASMFYVANTFPGYLGNMLAVNTIEPPIGFVPSGEAMTVNWKVAGVNPTDLIYAVHYNEVNGKNEMEYIQCTAKDGMVTFDLTSFGIVGLVRVLPNDAAGQAEVLSTPMQLTAEQQ